MLPDANFAGAAFSGEADFAGAAFSGDASFGRATFSGDVSFAGAAFSGDASFGRATFSGDVSFAGAAFSRDARLGEATFSGYANFRGARFGRDASFGRATFSGDANFLRARFGRDASFSGATFNRFAGFEGARFGRDATFDAATFSSYARFLRATFSGDATFGRATFSSYATFDMAAFSRDAGFEGARFSSDANFPGARFSGDAIFERATFSGIVSFVELSFDRDAIFARALFERARELAPFVVGARLVLDDCVFTERVRLEVAARVLSARAATFAAGALLRVRWAEMALDDADFARPSTLAGATAWHADIDLPAVCLLDDRRIELEPQPRLITLRGARIAQLSLSNVDLRACRFFGAHGLESLSIEAGCRWPDVPRGRHRVHRDTIAEEHAWRGWGDPATQQPAWLGGRDGSEPLAEGQVATLYRALRKAREDDRDQAGAGDLYYGEMEMRRRSKPNATPDRARGRGDTAILLAYWLLSGYGLRPARALIALTLTVLAAAAVLSSWGFHDPPAHPRGYARSVIFALESTISVLRPPETGLSAGGEITQICLRLLGPLLFGLALLAVRARVKR